ncbi:hypothetical protein IJJ08_03075 [bacterium]|nr:hypothetical protein [bacterium]
MTNELLTISSRFLQVAISPQASEWHQLLDKRTGIDYAWSGDPQHWAGRNPTLFPFIGKLNGGEYLYQGQKYPHTNHGFARHSLFQVIDHHPDRLTLELRASKTTRQVYPFEFALTNHYQVVNHWLHVSTTVSNYGDTLMPCTLGAHPAFACPWRQGDHWSDYYLHLPLKESQNRRLMNADGSWQPTVQPFGEAQDIPLTPDMFDQDVIALEGVQSPFIELRVANRPQEGVRLWRGNSQQLGIWSRPGSPFICLEPWLGRGDLAGWQGEILTRPETNFLRSGQQLTLQYALEIGADQTT